MIIPIRVEFFAGGLRPMITLALRSQNPKIFSFVNAIIDTGSPNTILGSADMQRMRISQVQMQKLLGEEKEVNLGGAQLKTRILPEAEFIIDIPVDSVTKKREWIDRDYRAKGNKIIWNLCINQ